MSELTEFRYFDKGSLLILLLITLGGIVLSLFFYTLEGIGYVICLLFLGGIIKNTNHVIYFDNNRFLVVKHLVFFRWNSIENAETIKCKLTGMGRSRDVLIYLYYLDSGKSKKSVVLHFRIFGYRKILVLLNHLQTKVKIDDDSFAIVGIYKIGQRYILQ